MEKCTGSLQHLNASLIADYMFFKCFSFESDCAHTFVRDSMDGTFSIVVQNSEDCRIKPVDCYRLVKIYYQDNEYVLKRSGK